MYKLTNKKGTESGNSPAMKAMFDVMTRALDVACKIRMKIEVTSNFIPIGKYSSNLYGKPN